MKSLNNCDQFDGLDSPGGGFRTIWNNALVGWMSRYGGLPSPNSIAVIPKKKINKIFSVCMTAQLLTIVYLVKLDIVLA